MNNRTEGVIKGPVMGKKAWLFFGNENAGQTAAIFYTLTMTCKRHSIDVQAYLTDVFRRIRTATPAELESLLPDRWIAAHPEARVVQRVQESHAAAAPANASDAPGGGWPFPAASGSAPSPNRPPTFSEARPTALAPSDRQPARPAPVATVTAYRPASRRFPYGEGPLFGGFGFSSHPAAPAATRSPPSDRATRRVCTGPASAGWSPIREGDVGDHDQVDARRGQSIGNGRGLSERSLAAALKTPIELMTSPILGAGRAV